MRPGVPLAQAIAPPGEAWDQGDIVDGVHFDVLDRAGPGVLVTPACDIEQDKVPAWTFVALFSDESVATDLARTTVAGWQLSEGQAVSKGRTDSLAKLMGDLLGQRFPRYHWLPVEHANHRGWVADFTFITSVPVKEARALTGRIASLRSSWREQLPTRYAAYLGRVGTDDFARDAIQEECARLAERVLALLRG